MEITGVAPFRSFKEKLSLIDRIQREFKNKVKITIDDGMILYTHIGEDKDGSFALENNL